MYYTLIISENYITKLYLKFNLLQKLSLIALYSILVWQKVGHVIDEK